MSVVGILEKEQEQSVVYGSIDFGKTIVANDKYKELVRSLMLLFYVMMTGQFLFIALKCSKFEVLCVFGHCNCIISLKSFCSHLVSF